ncbi:MAG: fibronectin type III domain-containing protein [Calditrichaeota bacterium]|nr:MAG: fibronectin type III domain-containing protein [Calditrichota bacterium]
MKPISTFLFSTLLGFFSCAHPPKVLDYIALPPPAHVQAELVSGQLKVQWELPAPYVLARIKQFNVYASSKSLIYTPIKNLPQPLAVVPNHQNSCSITHFPPGQDLFIHVRSQNEKGDLSLPSLPEIHLKIANSR